MAAADPAPAEAQNYFAMLRERPATLLPRLVAQWGALDGTAARVAALLGCDLVCSPMHLPNTQILCLIAATLCSLPPANLKASMQSLAIPISSPWPRCKASPVVQVHAVLRACTQPVQLGAGVDEAGGGSSCAPPAGSAVGEGQDCACSACLAAARMSTEAPALLCAAPPPIQPPAQLPGESDGIPTSNPATSYSASTAEVRLACLQ